MQKRTLTILFLLTSLFTFAQTSSFISYGVENGIAQSQIQTLEQDLEGNLWIGTMAGLSKFDGKNFSTFTKKNGLAEDWITSSLLDSKGNIWLGHWGGGITIYNTMSKKFENNKFENISHYKKISSIVEDRDKNLWFATEGAGLIKLETKTNKITNFSVNDGLISNFVTAITLDNKNRLWAAGDSGITIINIKGSANLNDKKIYITTKNGLSSNNITSIKKVLDDEIWIGTAENGLIIIKNSNLISIEKQPSGQDIINLTTSDGLSSQKIKNIYDDKSGNVWIGTKGGGIIKFNPTEQSVSNNLKKGNFKSYGVKQGLNYFNVNTIFEDRESNIWIGTELGLNQFNGERFQLFDTNDGVINNIVWSIYCDNKNTIWLGTNDGISKLTFQKTEIVNGLPKNFNIANYNIKDGLSSNVILSIFEDKDGNKWFGTANGGVCKLPIGSERFTVYNQESGLADNTVFSITQDDNGDIWMGTKAGASKLNPNNNTFTNYNSDNGLGGNYIYRIFKDSKGNLWFGALGGYLSVYNGNNLKTFDEKSGLNHRFILSIGEDKNHNIWLGAYGGGLYKFNGQNFKNYSVSDGMISDSPYSIICDNDNNIWIGTSRGIDKFNQEKNTFTHYRKQEGFLGIESNANSICKDKDGNVWFGTIMGAVKFNIKEDKINDKEPITSITGLKVFLSNREFPETPVFNYEENHLTFLFEGISLKNSNEVKYQYKLEGFDKDWSPITNITEAVYVNLPEGNYTFLVKAANSYGVWNKEPITYKFSIKAPYWHTWWFYILSILSIVTIVYLITKMRTHKLQQSKKKLEEKVKLRTKELALKNQELGKKNKDITDSINYAKRIQEAILPDTKKIYDALKGDCFIFYKPKDIVSGDFYFFAEKNNMILIGTVDCTGHGVPGALMSMIGSNFLNQIVNEKGIIEPSNILTELHQKIIIALNKDSNVKGTMDGMDVGLVCIDKTKNEIKFSGAVRPLYYITASGLNEIKGSRHSIGGIKNSGTDLYQTETIKFSKDEIIYLFTDGFVDQFGGESGKKFMTKQFKELIMGLKTLNMKQQQQKIEDTFNNWKGDLEQVDDILIIGIKL